MILSPRRLISGKTGAQILAENAFKNGSSERGAVDRHEITGRLKKLTMCEEEKEVSFAIDGIEKMGENETKVSTEKMGSQKNDSQVRSQKAISGNGKRQTPSPRQYWKIALEELKNIGPFHDNNVLVKVNAAAYSTQESQHAHETSAILLYTIELWRNSRPWTQTAGLSSPIVHNALNRIEGIIQVLKTTLDFQIGGRFWSIFSLVVDVSSSIPHFPKTNTNSKQNMLKYHMKTYAIDPEVFSAMADIATLGARYNVLANIFHHWPTMSIDTGYENEIINLAILMFRYIRHASELPYTNRQNEKLDIMKGIENNIQLADGRCRNISFTILEEGELVKELAKTSSEDEAKAVAWGETEGDVVLHKGEV